MSRRDALRSAGKQAEVPALQWGGYLVEHLFEVGPTTADGPLTFGEIGEWMRLTETLLSPFEVKLISRLSREYAAEAYAATKRDRPAPYGGSKTKVQRQKSIERDLDRFLA